MLLCRGVRSLYTGAQSAAQRANVYQRRTNHRAPCNITMRHPGSGISTRDASASTMFSCGGLPIPNCRNLKGQCRRCITWHAAAFAVPNTLLQQGQCKNPFEAHPCTHGVVFSSLVLCKMKQVSTAFVFSTSFNVIQLSKKSCILRLIADLCILLSRLPVN